MSDTRSHDAQVIVETAQAAVEPHDLAEHVVGLVVPAGATFHVEDLKPKLDLRGTVPPRTKGTVALTTVDELTKFVDEHYDLKRTTLWINQRDHGVTAVLNDAHAETPGWRDHRGVVTLELTDEWLHWTARHGDLLDQETFAEHVEDGVAEVVTPDGADLLEMAQSFHATSEATFRSARRLSSGEVKLVYDEDVQASAGVNGDMAIPDKFELLIAPFVGEDKLALTARLKYRLNAGKLRLGYRLIRPNEVIRDSLDLIAERLRSRFARVYLGDPR